MRPFLLPVHTAEPKPLVLTNLNQLLILLLLDSNGPQLLPQLNILLVLQLILDMYRLLQLPLQ